MYLGRTGGTLRVTNFVTDEVSSLNYLETTYLLTYLPTHCGPFEGKL